MRTATYRRTGSLLTHLRKIAADHVDWELVCAISDDERLLGTSTVAELLALPDDAVLSDAAEPEQPRVVPSTNREKAASRSACHLA